VITRRTVPSIGANVLAALLAVRAVLVAAAEQLLTPGPVRDPQGDPFDAELPDSRRVT
jgi:hypothetical protein